MLALSACPSSKQSALFRLSPQSLRLCPFASVTLDGITGAGDCDDLTFHAPAPGLLLLSSRSLGQSVMFTTPSSLPEADAATAQEILVPYSGRYATDARTVGVFCLGRAFAQVTPGGVLLNSDKDTAEGVVREVTLQDLLTQSRAPGVKASHHSNDGSVSASTPPTETSSTDAQIAFSALLQPRHLLLSMESKLLLLHCDAERNEVKVMQVLTFTFDICAVATAPPGLVCISLWSGDVLLFRISSFGVLAFAHCVPSPAVNAADTSPVRLSSLATVFLSPELSVHALITSIGDLAVTVRHIVHNTAQDSTQLTTAAVFTLPSGVRSITPLYQQLGTAATPTSAADVSTPLALLVQTIDPRDGGAYVVRCHVTLLDGCERQVPFMEWTCRPLVQPIGRPLPAAIFPVPEGVAVASSVRVGWLEDTSDPCTEHTGDEEVMARSRLYFGTLELDAASTHITARSFIPGAVHSLKMCADQRHVLVAYAHHADVTAARHQPLRVSGQEMLSSCAMALYDTHSLACVWQQDVRPDTTSAGALIGVLPGPDPIHANRRAALPATEKRFVSLLHAITGGELSGTPATASAVTTSLRIATYELVLDHAAGATEASQLVPVGSVHVTAESTYATAPISEREQQVLQSELLHFEALAEDLLVVCMPDNSLRLVGWTQDASGAMAVKELQNMPLENKVSFRIFCFRCLCSCISH
jgi:hypothetical protein